MKKIAIMTWFGRGRNYGQTLQAFALYTVLTKMGHSCELLSYGKNGPRLSDEDVNQLTGDARALQISFTAFIKTHLKYSPRLWKPSEVAAYMQGGGFDLAICGSDQIWNPFITDGYDPAYLLDFNIPCGKISYAASMIDPRYLSVYGQTRFGPALEEFQAVSVRENTAREIVGHLTQGAVDAAVVLDPTLLLTQEEWLQEIALPPAEPEKYIFCYLFFCSEQQKRLICQTARRYGCSTVIFSGPVKPDVPALDKLQVKAEQTASIERFLSLIQNAEVVITDSYHGTVFSIQFERPFFALESDPRLVERFDKGRPRNADRLRTLLGRTGLMSCLAQSDMDASRQTEPIDYEQVKSRLARERESSLSWLKTAIG